MSGLRAAGARRNLVAAAVAGALVLLAVGFLLLRDGDDARTITADFAATNEVRAGDPVRVGGVEVGEVADVALQPSDGTAQLTLRIENDDVEVGPDARARLRWRTLLGGSVYVDLDPGTPSAGGAGSDRIPISRTNSQVEFDDLNQILDGGTARAGQLTFRGFRGALDKPGAVEHTVDALSPTLGTVERGTEPLLGSERADLRRLVENSARVTSALGHHDSRLPELVDAAAATLRVTASRRSELGRFIELSPPALDATLVTTARINGTLARLDPIAAGLRPGARRLDPALRAATPALDRAATLLLEARPLLRDLTPAIRSLERASQTGQRFFERFDPTIRRLDEEILPWLDDTDPESERRLLEMLGPTFASAGNGPAGEFDGSGHWLRFAPAGGERPLLNAPCITFFTDPGAEEKIRCDELEETLRELFGGPQ